MRRIKKNRMEDWLKNKEINSLLMKDVVKSVLDVVEELHVTCKAGITKPRWREIMRKFKNNEQIYTSQQVIIESEPEEESEEEIDLTEENPDYVELQNYLSIVGKWNPKNIGSLDNPQIKRIIENENVEVPNLDNYVNNNIILGKAAKEINSIEHSTE